MSQTFDFTSLPADLLRHLLLGFSGRLHLHSAASVALSHNKQSTDVYSSIASDLLLAAWGENPFDGNCLAALLGNMESLPPLPAALLPVIKAVLSHWQPDATQEARAAMAGSKDEQLLFLLNQLRRTPHRLYWWHQLYEFSRIYGDWGVLIGPITKASPPAELVPLFSYALANAMLASGDSLSAAGIYRQCALSFPIPLIEERLATALLRSGEQDTGVELLQQSAQNRPWNVGLWLRLYELSVDGASTVAPLPGQTVVLGYSWNKGDDLAETLDSLGESDLSDVHVRILDNGSTDDTAQVIRRFVDNYGSGRASMITLPVNIGAPAARNWLMSLPEVRESDFTVFIDDDISLPKDWLTRLGAAVERYPDAGVWGCKVVDYDGPARVQCGEHNLTPSTEERRETLMSTIMLQDGDFGQTEYVRPCASVTGCVHLFRTERLLENGSFDLRFSPTQYDDLERDLRMVHAGGYAVYQGFLAIPHKRKSGTMSEAGKVESGNAMGNMYKLMAHYSPDEFESMSRSLDVVLLNDLQEKMQKLQK